MREVITMYLGLMLILVLTVHVFGKERLKFQHTQKEIILARAAFNAGVISGECQFATPTARKRLTETCDLFKDFDSFWAYLLKKEDEALNGE